MRACLTICLLLLAVAAAEAADVYEITSTDGTKTMKYEVCFGATSTHDVWTGFCPKARKFVSVSWLRGKEKPPAVAATIWDHETGRTIDLYRFPGCPDPLPVIRSIAELKVCPFTGDKHFKVVRTRIEE